jgi:hypothetical protein
LNAVGFELTIPLIPNTDKMLNLLPLKEATINQKSRKRRFSIKYFRLIERIQTIESVDEKDEWF